MKMLISDNMPDVTLYNEGKGHLILEAILPIIAIVPSNRPSYANKFETLASETKRHHILHLARN
jgi:hypothetical protein